jgi:hypothetical protein
MVMDTVMVMDTAMAMGPKKSKTKKADFNIKISLFCFIVFVTFLH